MYATPLYFQDVFGARGEISDTLEVSYSGRWEEELEDFVEEWEMTGSSETVDLTGSLKWIIY